MIRICSSLAENGYDVTLIGRKLKNSAPLSDQSFLQERLSLLFSKGKLFYIEYNIRLFFRLLFSDFDALCGVDLDSVLPCYFAVRLKGNKKLIYDAHELFTDTPEVYRRPNIRKIWLAVEKFIIPKTDLRYTVSQSIADEFEKRYGYPFDLIRNLPMSDFGRWALDFEKIQKIKPEIRNPKSEIQSSKSIIYLGNLNEGRGVEIAIDALKFINPEVQLWIIGDGDLRPKLENRVKESGLTERVKFFGFVTPEKIREILVQAKIGLHVLESKGLSYEYSLANKFFDYIQAGLPGVFTNLKEHKNLNDAYQIGIMIDKADARQTADAVNQLLNDPELYKTLHENCLKAAPVLSWSHEEKILLALYDRLVGLSSSEVVEKIDPLANQDYYMENGFCVFTEKFLLQRGYCCDNGCRHCPYKKDKTEKLKAD